MIVIDYLNQVHGSQSDFGTPPDEIDVRLAEIIPPSDLRAKDPRMAKAIQKKIRDLSCRGIFKVTLNEEITEGANELTARYVLAIKYNPDG